MTLKPVIWPNLFVAAAISAQELKPQELYQRVLPSVMTLHVESRSGRHFIGSAFLAVAEGVAVTSWHNVADARTVTARFADNLFAEVAALVDKDERADLALVRVAVSGRPKIQIALSNAPIGSRAYVVGAPKGYAFSIADGLLSQMHSIEGGNFYQHSCPMSGGSSGGPLLNEQGQAIGVTSWSKADAQNLNFASPISALTRLDPTREPIPWAKLEPSRPQSDYSANATAQPISPGKSADGFAEFLDALKRVNGQEATFSAVKKKGKKATFTVVVPANATGTE